jgi:crotonobetainyl-CoA:carnitine CoA-transferase CaiB-like acyl-CoA transferase
VRGPAPPGGGCGSFDDEDGDVGTTGLLDGITVLDLSRVLAGPYAGQLLADMGADVIKVEPPDGDPARGIGPHVDGRSLYFSSLNSGKRGIVLDLATTDGQDALEALLGRADILLENLRPGAAGRLGLTAAGLLERHPTLVVVSISGYARDSAWAEVPTLDLAVQAETGIMSVTGEAERPPARAGVPVGDLAAGMWAALAAVAGYLDRLRQGTGRAIEVPLIDATYTLTSYVATAAAHLEANPAPVGSAHHSVVPYRAFPTTDGWITIAVIGDRFWPALVTALDVDLGPLAGQELGTNPARVTAREQVDEAVATATARLTTSEAAERLAAAGVPHAPVNGILDALRTPYVAARGFVAPVATAEGSYEVVRGPLHDGRPLRPAPGLGEHTTEVLREVLPAGSPLLASLLPG